LPKNGEVSLKIYDTNGRMIVNKKEQFSKGKQQFEVANNLQNSGLYIYHLENENGVAKGKMNYLKN